MLILSRKPGERILIGDDVWIQVMEVRANGAVRLGIEAPADVRLMREELLNEPDQNDQPE